MESWFRIAIFALILISFLRRIFKLKSQGRPSTPGTQSDFPSPTVQTSFPPPIARPQQGRKDDFRDVPPPPENPDLG
jgi:hypothetical protein